MKKLGLILVAFVLIVGAVAMVYKVRPPSPGESGKNAEISDTSWDLPKLPEGLSWEKSVPSEADLESFRIFADDRYKHKDKDLNYNHYEIPVTGVLYSNTVEDTDPSYEQTGIVGLTTFTKSVEGLDWTQSLTYKDYALNGTAASGVQGDALGYIKIVDGKIRTVVYLYVRGGKYKELSGGGVDLECPCRVRTKIFISDPVELDKYLAD